MVYTESTK